jgi:hypothetical protein
MLHVQFIYFEHQLQIARTKTGSGATVITGTWHPKKFAAALN